AASAVSTQSAGSAQAQRDHYPSTRERQEHALPDGNGSEGGFAASQTRFIRCSDGGQRLGPSRSPHRMAWPIGHSRSCCPRCGVLSPASTIAELLSGRRRDYRLDRGTSIREYERESGFGLLKRRNYGNLDR